MRWQTLWEGRWIFAVIILLLAPSLALGWWIPAALCGLMLLFTLNFFRDPERPVPADPALVVSPADGVVTEITELDETEHQQRPMRRIGIFLSVFDVHVNRAPVAGEIIYRRHWPGKFLDARNPESSARNERMTWVIQGEHATLTIRQITGAIARRIVPWSQTGDQVTKGHRFGMIRFGSRTEIYLPLDAEILVAVGHKVKGASTPIARLR